MLLALPLVITSCDDHEHLDTGLHIGHVVCSDGQTLSVEECERLHKEPVAVVFSVSANGEDGEGLAVGLRELSPVEFSDTLGVAQGTSADTEKKMAMPTLMPCTPTIRLAHRWQMLFSLSGVMARAPISPA